ncbi:hypothetical protein [Cognatitamlana onchidii]|uniref:hypothetical protein n=1 Tax=Cognatitamlana onchidii TaxID=2562860 RepID=UPI0010A62CEE|nr:hypothetical protein [Algibacter onchidii]
MKPHRDRYLFSALALWFLVITLNGFSRFFFISGYEYQLKFHLKLHGIIFSSWVLLFFIQSCLIWKKAHKTHKILGISALLVVPLIFVSGFYTSFAKTPTTPSEIGDNLSYLFAFTIFSLLGFKKRKVAYKHKRFMVFASSMLCSAAVARLNFMGVEIGRIPLVFYSLMLLPMMAVGFCDLLFLKKRFQFNFINILALVVILYASNILWESKTWSQISEYVIELIS